MTARNSSRLWAAPGLLTFSSAKSYQASAPRFSDSDSNLSSVSSTARSSAEWVATFGAAGAFAFVCADAFRATMLRSRPASAFLMRRSLRDTRFFVGAEHIAQSAADLSDGRIRAHAIDDVGHCVVWRNLAAAPVGRLHRSRALQRVEPSAHLVVAAPRPQRLQLLCLVLGDRLIDVE